MKNFVSGTVLCLLIIAVLAQEKKIEDLSAQEKKIEDLSATEILQNEEYFNIYADCILDKGNCTPDATAVKSRVSDGFKDGCKRCTNEETEELKTIFQYLSEKKPDVFKLLTEKYDPDGSKKENYASLLA